MASLVESVNNGRARTAQLGEAWPKTAEALYNAIQSAYIMFLGTYEPFSKNRQKHSKKL